MALLTQTAPASAQLGKRKLTFAESQRLAKLRAYEKQAKRKTIKLVEITVFTRQLSSMLAAGLPLVTALEALQEQSENPVFKIIVRDVKNDVSAGASFSQAVKKYPKAFPNMFTSMVEAGEASGALADIMSRVATYFEDSVKLTRKVKGALTYPVAVLILAAVLVQVLLVMVVPVFAEMFADFGQELPAPTRLLIDVSDFLKGNLLYLIAGGIAFFYLVKTLIGTPKGRRAKDVLLGKLPIIGNLRRKVSVSRFCRTYAILLRSGVPILRSLEICGAASNNTYIEAACTKISRQISQGGQLSEVVADTPYFPSMVKHMSKAGEQTGNIDGMMSKIADFYDSEVETIVNSLTSLMEPLLIMFLGVVIGSIVMAMFAPIFQMSSVAF
jgi:type IV pilus assembly protein PilC